MDGVCYINVIGFTEEYILHLETACDPLLLVGHQHARQKKEVSLV
jgi:hypothetical protein